MVFKLVFFSNLLLASAALAAPSSRLESRLARRRENRQSQTLDRVEFPADAASNVQYSTNWAGAVLSEPGGTFTSVTGTFTVPTPSGNDGAATAWVGIDGDTCLNAIFQTGVDFTISGGEISYDAWHEWFPAPATDFTSIDINAGDTITLTVTANSANNGVATIENHTNGQTVTQEISSTHALCEEDAEWIVEDFLQGGHQVPFVNFGSVTFTDASATGPGGTTYTPAGATILDIKQNGNVMTDASINGDTVTVNYA